MSVRGEIASVARAAALDAVWRQWAALGAPVSGVPATAVIDPEALLLLTCALRDGERRLDDVLGWRASAGAALLSVQRVQTLRWRYTAPARIGLLAFARAATDSGDKRWKSLATGEALISRQKRAREPRLCAYPALVLRLRAAFGMGVKADVLAVLVAVGGADATVKDLVRATAYTAAAIRRGAQEMQAARVVHGSTAARPGTYRADPAAWSAFLGITPDARSGWRYFAELFQLLAIVIAWGESDVDDGYVAASAARDIFEAHRFTFEVNRIPFTDPNDAPGARYLDAFGTTVRSLANWLSANL